MKGLTTGLVMSASRYSVQIVRTTSKPLWRTQFQQRKTFTFGRSSNSAVPTMKKPNRGILMSA